ncbi:hypothetical protein ACIQNG_36220 [Streptomyces sp. NPDC091377]|uniref:hypothetical protein n=1 Tax=Streptomyces sp. NPDC091377 TaxID=3365995 RepID=UPI0038043CB1
MELISSPGAVWSPRVQLDKDREEWDGAWAGTGRICAKENGEPRHPSGVRLRFIKAHASMTSVTAP